VLVDVSVPNKPMVATATTRLASYSSDSLRRHIGQPLGCGERRTTSDTLPRQIVSREWLSDQVHERRS
jgi:hypothetical protein